MGEGGGGGRAGWFLFWWEVEGLWCRSKPGVMVPALFVRWRYGRTDERGQGFWLIYIYIICSYSCFCQSSKKGAALNRQVALAGLG